MASSVQTDYDPERALWVCGRRSFLFLGGMAAIGTAIGSPVSEANDGVFVLGPQGWVGLEDLVEVIPLSGGANAAVWRDGVSPLHLPASPLGPAQVVPRSVIEPCGITEVERGLWHLSHDGSVMWRRNAGRPVVKGMLGGREVMFPERGGLGLPPARSGAAWPSNPPQAINRRKERA